MRSYFKTMDVAVVAKYTLTHLHFSDINTTQFEKLISCHFKTLNLKKNVTSKLNSLGYY
jgi:hypothetical protein